MDAEQEAKKVKGLLVGGLAFIVSTWFAYTELKYLLRGRTVDAQVLRVDEVQDMGRRRSRTELRVEYTFKEADGTVRRERDRVPTDWPLPAGNTVKVQYLPGSADDSRLEGHRNLVFVALFLAGLGVMGFYGFRFWQEVREATRPSRPVARVRR